MTIDRYTSAKLLSKSYLRKKSREPELNSREPVEFDGSQKLKNFQYDVETNDHVKGKANKVYVAGHSVISETISEYNLLNSHHSFHDNIHGSLYKEQLNQSMDENHIEN